LKENFGQPLKAQSRQSRNAPQWDGDIGGPKEGLVLAVFYLRSAGFHILQAVVEAIPQLLRGVRMLLSTEGAAPWYLHLHDLTCGAMVFFLIYDPAAPFHWLE